MITEPEASGTFPSETLTWEELDAALLVVVVKDDGTVVAFTDDGYARPDHAAHLRTIANQIDPPAPEGSHP